MKKWLAQSVVSFLVATVSAVAAAQQETPKQELAQRLAINHGFSAQFEQVVKSADGELLSQGTGKVDITRPSLFRWETFAPDDNLIVSDGKTVWYYTPFVEQVSIYNQDQATAQTPFVLLTRNDEKDWQQYNVTQQGDRFTLTPVATDSNQGSFHIAIDKQGNVQGFDVEEQDGQSTQFTFNHIKLETPEPALFTFKVPEGVEIDDQRN
jgi:outer membrane lipoprotein carrier protein